MGLINSDIPELEGTDTETVLSNLNDMEVELERLLERRIAHLFELSDAILSDGEDEDIIKSIILSIRSDPEGLSERVLPENSAMIKSLYSCISLPERLMIFRRVFSKLYTSKKPFIKSYLDSVGTDISVEVGKIAYLNNTFNDAAYIAFADCVYGAKAHYEASVAKVCECVREGTCQFCILPIETSFDGKLLSFYRAIIRQGLKINLVYDMPGKSVGEYIRYALLGNSALPSASAHRMRSKDRYLDLLLPLSDGLAVSEVAMAAQLCSLEICSIDTISVKQSTDRLQKFFAITLKIARGDINTFLSYLSVDCPGFVLLGLYTRI